MEWTKSSLSQRQIDCVETAVLPERAGVAIRDSKDPDGGMLACPTTAWHAFVAAARAEEFGPPA